MKASNLSTKVTTLIGRLEKADEAKRAALVYFAIRQNTEILKMERGQKLLFECWGKIKNTPWAAALRPEAAEFETQEFHKEFDELCKACGIKTI